MALKLDNIRLSYKFFIITVVPVLMLGALAARVVHDDFDRLATDRTGLSGIQPALDLLRVIQLTQHHLSVSVVEQVGDSGLRAAREGIAKDVEAGLQTSSDSASRVSLASADERFTAIRKAWEAVSPAASPESLVGDKLLSLHIELLSRQAGTLEDIADSSALTLDPQPGNYHLVRTAFFQLPALTDALSNSRAVAAGALARGHLADADRVTLEGLRQFSNGSLAAISRSLQKAAGDSPAHQPRLQALEAQITSEASALLKLISEQVLDAAMLSLPSQQFLVDSTKAIDAQFVAMNELSQMLSSNIEARSASVHRELVLVLLAVAFGVLVSTTLALIVARRTSGSLRRAVDLAKAVAAGDLTSNIESRSTDEIGELLAALNGMNQSLATVVSTVRNGSDSVATGSSQIASGNADLSQRTEEQASSLQQTVASLAQLTETIRANAQSAQQSGVISSAAFESANDGAAKVSRVSELMQEIRSTSQKMADITGTIDSIAFQTNILALNASVEAARAGEQGRGFAVVASEVRGLAQRSASAAREIASLISHNSEQVRAGADLAVTAGVSMMTIVKSIEEVASLAKEIGDASTQQAQGLAQVNTAMEQLDTVTQQNAALVEQSTAAAESLKIQADKLAQAVRQFNVHSATVAAPHHLVPLVSQS